MEDSEPVTDSATSGDSTPSQEKGTPDAATSGAGAKTEGGADQASTETRRAQPGPRGATFANTRQHLASRLGDQPGVERFANTKLNIALINDPKNGPRFTMTKRESGLGEQTEEPKAAVERAGEADKAVESPPAPAAKTAEPISPPKPAAAEAEPARATTSASQTAPIGVPPAAEPPARTPIDSSKTFVGPNGTYYDESWRWMDWRGTRRSWNWSAALSFGHWFAYRRLYWIAGLYLVWLGGLAAAAVNDAPILLLAVLALAMVGLTGAYANSLYFQAFRRAVSHVTEKGEGDYQELKGQLAAAGGADPTAPFAMAAMTLATIAAALGLTYYLRGDFALNFWPF
jgi:hypothetical protein